MPKRENNSDALEADSTKGASQAIETRPKRSTRLKKLTPEIRAVAVALFAQGYTVRFVRTALKKELGRVPTDQELLRIAVEEGESIEQMQDQLEQDALVRGLARKGLRVKRLNELAEVWEKPAEKDPRAAKVYQDTIKQIREEIEPLGLKLILPENDPWAELLTQLQASALERSQLPKSSQLMDSTQADDKSDQTQKKSS